MIKELFFSTKASILSGSHGKMTLITTYYNKLLCDGKFLCYSKSHRKLEWRKKLKKELLLLVDMFMLMRYESFIAQQGNFAWYIVASMYEHIYKVKTCG